MVLIVLCTDLCWAPLQTGLEPVVFVGLLLRFSEFRFSTYSLENLHTVCERDDDACYDTRDLETGHD